MEKLNELREAFYPQYGTPGSRDMDVTARRKVIDDNIEAVAEAFRSLERTSDTNMAAAQAMRDDMYHWKQRAEAAEAKLAELAKQEPTGLLAINTGGGWRIAGEAEYIYASEHGFAASELFTRPAPAADLADLVPDGWKLVPVEPTKQMLEASYREASVYSPTAYRAMLAAAPTPNE